MEIGVRFHFHQWIGKHLGVGITFKWLKLYINMEMYYKYKIYLFFFRNVSTNRRMRDNKNIFVTNIFHEGKKFSKMTFGIQKKENLLKEIKETKNQKKEKLVASDKEVDVGLISKQSQALNWKRLKGSLIKLKEDKRAENDDEANCQLGGWS